MTKEQAKPHYGYYALYVFTILSAVIMVIGMFVAVFASLLAGSVIIGIGALIILAYAISMHLARQTESFSPPSILELRGDETVLDVGCGLGKTTIGVAKHLSTGKVIGIDIWSEFEIPGNSSERAYANAEAEGVRERVEFRTGNVLSIPFPDSSFDVVTSSSVLNNLHTDSEKLGALKEILRVLVPGGRFLLLEPLRDSWHGLLTFGVFFAWMILPKDRWIRLLKDVGFVDLKYDYYHGMGAFLVVKPYL